MDHFRYFAGVIRAQEGGISEIDGDTVAYHLQRATRGCWSNYSLELPTTYGIMENCSGFSSW